MTDYVVTRPQASVTVVKMPVSATITTTQSSAEVIVQQTSITVVGPRGPAGADGPPGESGGSHVYTQVEPSAIWTIRHALPFAPAVTTVNALGAVIRGAVNYPEADTVTITFSEPISGQAYLS